MTSTPLSKKEDVIFSHEIRSDMINLMKNQDFPTTKKGKTNSRKSNLMRKRKSILFGNIEKMKKQPKQKSTRKTKKQKQKQLEEYDTLSDLVRAEALAVACASHDKLGENSPLSLIARDLALIKALFRDLVAPPPPLHCSFLFIFHFSLFELNCISLFIAVFGFAPLLLQPFS